MNCQCYDPECHPLGCKVQRERRAQVLQGHYLDMLMWQQAPQQLPFISNTTAEILRLLRQIAADLETLKMRK